MNKELVEVKAELLIRKPIADVFEAFVNPDITTKFWFTKGNGRLEKGRNIQWDWEMYHISIQVNVLDVIRDKRILIEWPGYGTQQTVEWLFSPQGPDATFVSIRNAGFKGDDDEIVKNAIDSMGGFTSLLAGAKAFLEYHIQLNLVGDHHPEGL